MLRHKRWTMKESEYQQIWKGWNFGLRNWENGKVVLRVNHCSIDAHIVAVIVNSLVTIYVTAAAIKRIKRIRTHQ
jgi:hypothetical protein